MKEQLLTTEIALNNSHVQFSAFAGKNNPILIDYVPPIGNGEGYTSLELLMISLSTCLTTSVLTLLRKKNKNIVNAYATSTGKRRTVHPTYLEEINIQLNLISSDTSVEELNEVLKISESTICPVINMLNENIQVNIEHMIHKPEDLDDTMEE
ncbi:MAG: OsmC family protein [Candidatus Cloacimonetes bacterium]|jgi:putative redox protein|nr:OsmC family protein [Candidatus Cloacimonadota bacterium]